MKLSRGLPLFTIAMLVFAPTRFATAQDTPNGIIQFGLGAGSSAGGRFVARGEMSAEGMIARHFRQSQLWMIGAAAQTTFMGGNDLTCYRDASGACDPIAPRLSSVTALFGVGREGSRAAVNAFAGPSIIVSPEYTRLGAQARVDLVRNLVHSVSLTLSPRASVVPNLRGSTVMYTSVTIGVRVASTQ